MAIKVPADLLRRLYEALLADPPATCRPSRLLARVADEGWAQAWLMEDALLDMDRRLYHAGIEPVELAGAFNIPVHRICQRPKARSGAVSIDDALAAKDFACLLIVLEMLGFEISPGPLVQAMLPMLPRRGYITESELEVVWYEKRRQRSSIALQSQDAEGKPVQFRDHKLANGYKLQALVDADEAPLNLTVRGPKYRRTPDPVETKCPDCSFTWWRGDPDSSASHRREHKRRMSYLDPQPHEHALADMQAGGFEEYVDWKSPSWRQDEVYERAYAFKREMHYDFIQWSKSERDPNVHGYLFTTDEGRIVGACSFRLRKPETGAPRWGLQWIWVAPKHRRKGILRARWPALRRRYGEFFIEPPVSDAMQSFARSAGDAHLLQWNDAADMAASDVPEEMS